MKMMKNLALLFANGALSIFLLACSAQNTPSLLTSTSTGSAETINKIIDAVPFAYDLAVDTISYNSCVGINLNGSGLHGIKIGAHEGFVDPNGSGAVKGGLKLRSDFLQYLALNISPTYPNTTIVPSQIQYILQNSSNNMSSPANSQLYVQYAVRNVSDLTVVPDAIQKTPDTPIVSTRDGVYEFYSMTEDSVLSAISKSVIFGPKGTVLSEGPRVYNIGPKSSPKPFEATLGYSNSQDETFQPVDNADDTLGAGEQYSDLVRTSFNSNSIVLAVTYGNPSTTASSDITNGGSNGLNSPKRKAGASPNRGYGRAFELGFVSKNSARSSQRKNVLNRVIEKNLEDGVQVSGVSWSCENVVIMKTGEWNNKKVSEPACSELTASDLAPPLAGTDPKIKERVAKLRRHYPENQWGIGLFYDRNSAPGGRQGRALCLVNKATECYLPTVGLITTVPAEDIGVEYDYSKDCYLSRYRAMGVSYVGNLTGDAARRLRRCPQYASICVRTSTSY